MGLLTRSTGSGRDIVPSSSVEGTPSFSVIDQEDVFLFSPFYHFVTGFSCVAAFPVGSSTVKITHNYCVILSSMDGVFLMLSRVFVYI